MVGFEPSDYARKIMNARGIPCAVPDLTRSLLEQIDRPAKAVTMLDVLEHVEKPVEILAYLRDGVATGGCLIVLTPAFPHLWSEWDERLGHQRRYTINSLEEGNRVRRLAGRHCEVSLFCNVPRRSSAEAHDTNKEDIGSGVPDRSPRG